jgi:hypothetical protein
MHERQHSRDDSLPRFPLAKYRHIIGEPIGCLWQ